jgi:hypothetical protein
MLVRICLALSLLACVPAWCQVQIGNTEAGKTTDTDDSQLKVPPPVSVLAYSSNFEGDTSTNYLTGGIAFTTAYSSNVAYGASPISDMTYSIFPTIGLDKTTSRMHLLLNYAPGFTFYQRATALNQNNQNFSTSLQYHLSPNLTAIVSEGFQKTSNIFDQPNPLSATPVSGSVPVSVVAIISPGQEMMTNTTSAQLAYQVSEGSLIGGGGNYSILSYSNPALGANQPTQVGNLYDSRSAGGSAFYSTRIHEKAYLGVSYQYQNSLSFQDNAPSTETQTQTVFLFLTMYLKPNFSVSVSAGPQHYSATQALQAPSASWQPLTMVSASWQGERTTVSGSYSRMVSGGGGLSGAFHTNNASLGLSWRASRNWSTGVSGGYSNYQSLTPQFLYTSAGGHTLFGTASLQRTLGSHAGIQFGYNWTHQSYPGVVTSSNNPNINRVFVTLSFTFSKPLQK